ncbi:thioredoxin family protein [Chloroflexota bacterium]
MSKVKIEAFLSVPACSGGVNLTKLLKEIEEQFGDKVEVITYRGRHEIFEKYNLSSAPALVVGELVRIMGVCPSKESLIAALREAGLD